MIVHQYLFALSSVNKLKIMFEHVARQDRPKDRSNPVLEECFKVMKVKGRDREIYVPACIQFKIRNFTEINFENLQASVIGILCVTFLIFTKDKNLETFLADRLYFNPEEAESLKINRRKKMERDSNNYVALLFNKDGNIKVPTTRSKQFQIQSFKTKIKYRKGGANIEGIRIFHTLRKQFSLEIVKTKLMNNFLAPFGFINLELVISIEHMDTGWFKYQNQVNIQKQEELKKNKKINVIEKVGFNLLRIEEPFMNMNKMGKDQRVLKMAPMLAYSSEQPFGTYDVVQTKMEGYTHDEREFKGSEESDTLNKYLFEDYEPSQLHFKPFKYVVFKIPLFRYPVVDMMTIFIPIWLLSFVSVYIYFQSTEIMNRIVNVAGLMIAYAAIQPIVRENLPQATTITLVDLLIYSQLIINILFLAGSIDLRHLYDGATPGIPFSQTNEGYNRWTDGLFLASLVISGLNVVIVVILIYIYMQNRPGYKAESLPKNSFQISNRQNWTLTLLMERTFARYKEQIIFLD